MLFYNDKVRIVHIKKEFTTFFVLAGLHFLGLFLVVSIINHGSFSGLIWEGIDARHFKWMSNNLITLTHHQDYFFVGYPIYLSVFNLLTGQYVSDQLFSLIELNRYIILFNCLLYSLGYYLIIKAINNSFNIQESLTKNIIYGIAMIILNVWYSYSYTPFDTVFHDGSYLSLMTLGLVPAYEPFIFVFSSIIIYYFSSDIKQKIPLWVIGSAIGFLTIIKETNVALTAMFIFGLLITQQSLKRKSAIVLLIISMFSIQLLYNYFGYGGGLFPGRDIQLKNHFETGRFLDTANRLYNLNLTKTKSLGIEFFKANISENFSYYLYPFLIFLTCFFYLLLRRKIPYNYAIILFLTPISIITAYSLTPYVIGATMRYLHCTLPFFIFIVFSFFSILKVDFCFKKK